MRTLKKLSVLLILSVFTLISCDKEDNNLSKNYVYYQVGFKDADPDWRDTAFVVRTRNLQLIKQADAQLALPVSQRKIVFGTLREGNGGYNKNSSHAFKWHFKEDDWKFVDVTAEIYDGNPYTDLDLHYDYFMDTIKGFGAWDSYLRKKLDIQP